MIFVLVLFFFFLFQNSMTRVPDSLYQCNGESSIEVSFQRFFRRSKHDFVSRT